MEKGSDPLKSSDPLNPHGHDVYGLIPLSLSHFVALKAVAHKLARACYHILRDLVPFQVTRAFAA